MLQKWAIWACWGFLSWPCCVVSLWVCINELFPSSMTLRVARLMAKFTALFTAQVRDARGRGVTSTIIKNASVHWGGCPSTACMLFWEKTVCILCKEMPEIELSPLPKTLCGTVYWFMVLVVPAASYTIQSDVIQSNITTFDDFIYTVCSVFLVTF